MHRDMDNIIIIDGEQLEDFRQMCEIVADRDRPVRHVRVAIDDGGAKFKINEWVWSPPLGHEEGPLR